MTILVVGLGAAGSAALYHLARQGATVIGIDPWRPPHSRGSTHGRSRIHRRAYMEGALYLPLLQRADGLWEALERDSGRSLLRRTGALMLGPVGGALLDGSQASALEGGIPVEALDGRALRRRFPVLDPPPGYEGLFEPGAGALDPEAAVEAHLEGASKAGATIRTGEGLLGWEPVSQGIRVRTNRGEILAERLILASGPWLPGMLGDGSGAIGGGDPARPMVERQVTGHFTFRNGPADGVPILMLDRGDEPLLYVIPEVDGTLKAGLHHGGDRAHHPSKLRREVLQDDEVRIAAPLGGLIPQVAPRWVNGSVCLYTNAPDGRWRIGRLPGEPRVVVLSACSGHGFKVSAAVGEAAAALALDLTPPVPLTPFALDALP